MAARAYQRDGNLSGLATGLTDLDSQHGRPAAVRSDHPRRPPRHGQNRARHQHRLQRRQGLAPANVRADGHMETVNGGIVGFFSLEMSAEQLATRIIAEQTGIPSNKIRRGGIDEADFEKIKDVSIELQNLPFYVDETGGLSIGQLAARARRLKRQRGLDLLVIDYLQLLQGSSRRSSENRVQEITEITTRLKALAKELNVPILALSQLSRQVESREDKRPQLSDLRESGSIEQDADVVMFVFREEYYHQMRKPHGSEPGKVRRMAGRRRARRRQGRSDHRQAAPRPDRHRRTAIRRRGHPLRQSRHRAPAEFLGGLRRSAALPPPQRAGHKRGHGARANRLSRIRCRRPGRARDRRHADHRSCRHRGELADARAATLRPSNARPWSRPMPMASASSRSTRKLAKAGCKTFFVADLAEARRVRSRARGGRDLCAQRLHARLRRRLCRAQRAAGHQQHDRACGVGRLRRASATGAAARRCMSTPA